MVAEEDSATPEIIEVPACGLGLAAAQLRVAVSEFPRARRNVALRAGRDPEHLVEPAEANQRQQLEHRVAACELRVVLPRPHGDRTLAVHRRRIDQHVQVVDG